MDPRVKTSTGGPGLNNFQAETRMASIMTEVWKGAASGRLEFAAQLEKDKRTSECFDQRGHRNFREKTDCTARRSRWILRSAFSGSHARPCQRTGRHTVHASAAGRCRNRRLLKWKLSRRPERDSTDVLKRWSDFKNTICPRSIVCCGNQKFRKSNWRKRLHQEEPQGDEE